MFNLPCKLLSQSHFNMPNNTKLATLFCSFPLMFISPYAVADIQARSSNLNYSQKSLSNAGNPAAAAYVIERKDPHVMTGGYIELGGGVEYGDFDELFEKIDELSALFNPPNEDDGTLEEQPPTLENGDRDYQWQDLFQAYPELEGRLEVIKTKVAATAALLSVIAAEGYGKAEGTGEMSFILSEDLYGGSLLFGSSFRGNSKVLGLFDEINFDSEQARSSLATIPDFDESDPIQQLDLSGGVSLYYNPKNNNVKMTVSNDSLLLVKASLVSQLSLSYSRKAFENESGKLYWGVKPIFYNVGLTNVSARIGEVTDAEALFDDIQDAEFDYQNGFDMDIGLVWAAENYQLGAGIANVIEQTYDFPELNERGLSSERILSELNGHKSYTMERQLKLDAGIFTEQRHWSLNAELDVNAIEDTMNDEYQWFTLTGGYASESWWLPSARFGLSRNLAGSELTYVNAGVTVMKVVNIDASTTLDTVTLDGNNIRRGMNIRIGVQFDY